MNVSEMIRRLIMVVPDCFKTQELCKVAVSMEPNLLLYVPDCFKTHEMCKEAVHREPYKLRFIPDNLKTREICNEVMRVRPAAFFLIPDSFKTQDMCIKGVEACPWQLYYVPDQTRETCDRAARNDFFSLHFVPDWFVTQEQIDLWHDDDDYGNNDEIIVWYEGYKRRKTQKASIKEELVPIAWYLDRVKDWCLPEDEKRRWK